jgi:hypothetical protein
MANARKKLSLILKQDLLLEAGYRCGNPRCPVIMAVHLLEDHHIIHVEEGGKDEISNLLALCPNCHTLYHHGNITREAIRHWKGMLLALNHAFDRESLDLLLYLHRTQGNTIAYRGDGVLRFARLIAADLVALTVNQVNHEDVFEQDVDLRGPMRLVGRFTTTSHQVGLTEKGRMLLDAWRSGDAARYQTMISTPPWNAEELKQPAGAGTLPPTSTQ